MDEKRKHPRYKAHILIKYKRLDNPITSWQVEPEINNISLGGLSFNAYEKMPIGTALIFRLQIFTEDSSMKIIELKAVITRIEEDEGGIASYKTGVIFTEPDNSTKSFLKQFISYLEP